MPGCRSVWKQRIHVFFVRVKILSPSYAANRRQPSPHLAAVVWDLNGAQSFCLHLNKFLANF